ncbi:MAG TPA: ABC transporter ATP-binding protein [Burkholderiaceae bacterium]|jgi:simple sugar transport system ATP-binding protein
MTAIGAISASAVPATGAIGIELYNMQKRFVSLAALDNVSINIPAGDFHALLGENGAGKSTLVKCLVGFYKPDDGQILINGRETAIASPKDADACRIGMVYQHFTLIPSMTVAENLVISKGKLPARIDWKKERAELDAFMQTVPFKIDLDAPASSLAAGEKQKVEIVKQLYLKRGFLILDEPTSVLTPSEADEILGLVRDLCARGELTVLLITHKFREVMAFAKTVSVLRRGRFIGTEKVGDMNEHKMAEMMMGETPPAPDLARTQTDTSMPARFSIDKLNVRGDKGTLAVKDVRIAIKPGEIVGIAGVSGNGQRELVESLIGQRDIESGTVIIHDEIFTATRRQIRKHKLYSLPEEPLKNACVPGMSVADNVALRNFDVEPLANSIWLRKVPQAEQARRYVSDFNVKCTGIGARIDTLSGGNVQRAVLARELSQSVDVLIVSNPVFGLDFAAVAETYSRIMAARNYGTAVLLISEDLDELLTLADRIVVMSEGELVHEVARDHFNVPEIGRYMAGGSVTGHAHH